MTKFTIHATDAVVKAVMDLCAVKGSHLTLAIISKHLYMAAISPEFFKILDMNTIIESDDLAIRIQKTMIKPLLSNECSLQFTVNKNVIITRSFESTILSAVAVPLEYDFNNELIAQVILAGSKTTELYNISSLIRLRPLLVYCEAGIQYKDGLAYMLGNDFFVYCELAGSGNFIMTNSNITELIKFIRAYGEMKIYESGVHIVFHKGYSYFGCRQPIAFVDSEYESFKQMTPIKTLTANLTELHLILKAFTIPKGETPDCKFMLSKGIATIDIGDCYHFDVLVGSSVEGIPDFSLPVEVLKKIFSNIYIDYNKVDVLIYEPLVVFKFGDIQILIRRSDSWED